MATRLQTIISRERRNRVHDLLFAAIVALATLAAAYGLAVHYP